VTGKRITGIDEAEKMEGITVYHAGTKLGENGEILTAGGRVLDVTGVASTFEEARSLAYSAVDVIDFEGKQFRTDIGAKAIV
jgi:phosphoribosylamine--glycine ligase